MNPRNTHQKQIILETIQGRGRHMCAEQVLAEAQKKDPGIGLATVYRNLNLLEQQGKIQKIRLHDSCFYDGNPEPHDHFRCTVCGKFEDLDMKYEKRLDTEASEKTGYVIQRHAVLYEGICAECAQKMKEEDLKSWN